MLAFEPSAWEDYLYFKNYDTQEHRLIYKYEDETPTIASCRFHYQ